MGTVPGGPRGLLASGPGKQCWWQLLFYGGTPPSAPSSPWLVLLWPCRTQPCPVWDPLWAGAALLFCLHDAPCPPPRSCSFCLAQVSMQQLCWGREGLLTSLGERLFQKGKRWGGLFGLPAGRRPEAGGLWRLSRRPLPPPWPGWLLGWGSFFKGELALQSGSPSPLSGLPISWGQSGLCGASPC